MAKRTRATEAPAKPAIVKSKQQEPENTSDLAKIRRGKDEIMVIPGVRSERVSTLAVGVTPLVMHKFSQKVQQMIVQKHMGEASEGRQAKDPVANYNAARHRLSDGSDGIPAGGIRGCIISGCSKEAGIAATRAKKALHVDADDPATNLVRIICPHPPRMIENVVKNESGVIDIRHRPEYWPWAIRISVEFLPAMVSAKRVLQAIAMAGFGCGLGEWRPLSKKSTTGSLGRFRLATPEEVEQFLDGQLFASHAAAQAAE